MNAMGFPEDDAGDPVPFQPASESRRLDDARRTLEAAEDAVLSAGAVVLGDAQAELDAADSALSLSADHLIGAVAVDQGRADEIAVKWAQRLYQGALASLNEAEDTINAAAVGQFAPAAVSYSPPPVPPPDGQPGRLLYDWFHSAVGCPPATGYTPRMSGPGPTVNLTWDEWRAAYPQYFTGAVSAIPGIDGATGDRLFYINGDRGQTVKVTCGPPPPPTAPPPPPPTAPPPPPPASPPPPAATCPPPTICDMIKQCGPASPPPPPQEPTCRNPDDPLPPPPDCTYVPVRVVYNGAIYDDTTEPNARTLATIAAQTGTPEISDDGDTRTLHFSNGYVVTESVVCPPASRASLLPECPPPTVPPPPVPPPPPGPTPATPTATDGWNWDDPGVCQFAAAQIGRLADGGIVSYGDWLFHNIMEASATAGESVGGIVGRVITGLGNAFAEVATDTFEGLHKWTVDNLKALTGDTGTDPVAAMAAGSTLGIGAWVQWATGLPMDYMQTPIRHAMQYAYPVNLPTQAGLDAMYLTSKIDRQTWTCYTKALGNLPNTHYQVLDAGRSRPNIAERVQQYYRGDLDRATLDRELRSLGVLDPREGQVWIDLFQQVPTSGDIVRFMVRDSADEAAVALGGFDVGFTDKYKGKLRDWARAQGVSDEYMKYIWRSHWELPSPTQLYEMLHRLRPGRVDPRLAVTPDVVKKTLEQNDMSPGFVDRMMAISYHPITLTDIQRGYLAGTIPDGDLEGHLQDGGYSEADAATVAQIIRDDSIRRINTMTGQWTAREVCKQYRQGTLTRDEADRLLKQSLTDEGARTQALDNAETMLEAQTRATCIKAIRWRYMTGELNDVEARVAVSNQGVPAVQGRAILEAWRCEKTSRRKEPTVAMLRTWFLEGVIGSGQFALRLRNLGYSPDDAIAIVRAAETWLTRQQAKKGTLRSDFGLKPEDPPKPPRPKAATSRKALLNGQVEQ